MKAELQVAYNALLKRKREIEVADKNGTVKCQHCGSQKSLHPNHDPRCSTWVCSQIFKSVDADELERIEASLLPIEAILNVN